jgi:hypothetical protein
LHSKKAHNGGTFSRAKKSPHWVAGITEEQIANIQFVINLSEEFNKKN